MDDVEQRRDLFEYYRDGFNFWGEKYNEKLDRVRELEAAMVRAADKLEMFGNEEPVAVASYLRDIAEGGA